MTSETAELAAPGAAVLTLLRSQAREHGSRTAIHQCGAEISYADLCGAVAVRAAGFDGLGESTVLLFQPRRDIDSLITILAGVASRAIILIADPSWTDPELDKVIASCRVTHRVGASGRAEPAAGQSSGHGLTAGWTGVSFGRFTSGSTRSSRCLGFSERTALAAARAWATAAGLGPADRVACCAAFHNGLAFNTSLLSVLGAGAQLVLPGERLLPSSVLRLAAAHQVTRLVAFPFFLDLVVRQGLQERFGQLRQIVSSAEGRIGRIANVGGRKIDPAEVEQAIRQIDGVADACVMSIQVHGRPALAAFIESASLSRRDVVRALTGQVADYKIPAAIRISHGLPRGAVGKVSRERLLAEFKEN